MIHDEETRLASMLGPSHDERDVERLYAEINDRAAASSCDPDGYVFVCDTDVPWILSSFAGINETFAALDLYRRAYGRLNVCDPSLELRLADFAYDPKPPGKRCIMERDDPIFRLLACLSVCAKLEDALCPLIFEKASKELGFLYIYNDVLRAELEVMERVGYRLTNLSRDFSRDI